MAVAILARLSVCGSVHASGPPVGAQEAEQKITFRALQPKAKPE